jgi:hypothetical protein
MTMSDQDELHAALLALGGRVSDATLATARLQLAESGTVRVPEPAVELAFTFRPALPDPRTFGRNVPPLLDLVGRELTDEIDRAAVEAAQRLPDTVALWRAWRMAPEWAAGTIPPGRIYVLEANGQQAQTTAAMMQALSAAGLDLPQVEVVMSGTELPTYTRTARNCAALLWLDGPVTPVRIARVFDEVDADGARFRPEHERLTGDDLEQVAGYLEAGTPVLATTGRMPDVVTPERGKVVPMTYRTDGQWLWSESATYYLRTYGLAPDPELLHHARSAGALLPAPGPAEQHRALALLFQSAALVPAAGQ